MMRRVRSDPREELTMDLTPLIDCVFLLILFFLLTTEITVQIEDVDLPFAIEGEQESKSKDASAPLIINVKRLPVADDSSAGQIVFNGASVDKPELTTLLKREASHDANPRPYGRGRGWEAGPGGVNISKLKVIVRADRGVRFEYLRTIFAACAEAAIYKLKISTVLPE